MLTSSPSMSRRAQLGQISPMELEMRMTELLA
jgi:hypothetical protein